MSTLLRLALTKGRLESDMRQLLAAAGVDISPLLDTGRRLIHRLPDAGIEVVLAKAPDVITYIEHGVCELGVVGKDTILELGSSFYEVLDLGFGACRFALAAREGDDFFGSTRHRRVASKYPKVTAAYFAGRGMDAEIIKIEGSVELAPILGLADAIVDIVETGATLSANGLAPIEDICPISARLIVNVAAMKMKKAAVQDFVALCRRRLEGEGCP
ncbi:MAG: ATP phosphoribosyltransferase [Oscillospiraceae bacterium]|nr:ATP phosphoribosyltransferase [Oscillospiraceae bacterium]